MRGLLSDVNLQGYMPRVCGLLASLDLMETLQAVGIEFATFVDVGYAPETNDREIWTRCQDEGWILFTDNRNRDGPDSLEATLDDSWTLGCLPVLTLSKKGRLEHDREYAERVVGSLADILFGIACGELGDRPRMYVPLNEGGSPS